MDNAFFRTIFTIWRNGMEWQARVKLNEKFKRNNNNIIINNKNNNSNNSVHDAHCPLSFHLLDSLWECVSSVREHTSARFGVLITFCFYSNVFYFKALFFLWMGYNSIYSEITANLTFYHSAYRIRAALLCLCFIVSSATCFQRFLCLISVTLFANFMKLFAQRFCLFRNGLMYFAL